MYLYIFKIHGGYINIQDPASFYAHPHAHTPTYDLRLDPSLYTLCACGQKVVWMCIFGFPAGWSSGIQQPLLKCQSGLTELGKAQTAVLDFSNHTATPTHPHPHTVTHTSTHFTVGQDLMNSCFICSSLKQNKKVKKACRRKLIACIDILYMNSESTGIPSS